MKRSDRYLGMNRDISRRDFVQGVGVSAAALAMPWSGLAADTVPGSSASGVYYPPTKTGLRGAHPGSFETAHSLVLNGARFDNASDTTEEFDLVVVGGGISGLASAYYYREQFGPDSRILVLENHDDFGGHAKRNEFHQGGEMRLAWGGAMNLEYSEFSENVHRLFRDLGVDIQSLADKLEFYYGYGGGGGPSIYFDADTYGEDILVPNASLRFGNPDDMAAAVHSFPISESSRRALNEFYNRRENVFAGKSEEETERILSSISYTDFLQKYGNLPPEVTDLFEKTTHGFWGVGADSLSVSECLYAGLPIRHLLGEDPEPFRNNVGEGVAMFPDGNSSVARLLVKSLIPNVSRQPGNDDIALQAFDYAALDLDSSLVRIRLNSTVVNVQDHAQEGVAVTYVQGDRQFKLKSRHTVLACNHSILPYLCPQLPEEQKRAQAYQVKRPLILTNVLLRSSEPFEQLGIAGAYCPGRLHGAFWLTKGVNTAGYHHSWDEGGAVPVMFWGAISPPEKGLDIKSQHQASRRLMMTMNFEDYEREVRTVLDGMLSSTGFSAADDILAITVNRWPHGYAYDYLDLWDPDWAPGEAPHEIARKRFGNMVFANADAGADAYLHVAVDQARRAVDDLLA